MADIQQQLTDADWDAAFDALLATKERAKIRLARLGRLDPVTGLYDIDVDGREGYVWITMVDGGATTQNIALNQTVQRKENLPIRVREDPYTKELTILGGDGNRAAAYLASQPGYSGVVPPHHHNPGSGLEYLMKSQMIEPGRVRPTAPVSLRVLVYPCLWRDDEGVQHAYNGGQVNLTSVISGISSNMKLIAKIAIDKTTNTAVVFEGPETAAPLPALWADAAAIETPNAVPLYGVVVRDGQTQIKSETDFFDCRGWIGASVIKHNLSATTDPTTGDDVDAGYTETSWWLNTSSGELFVCSDASTGAAAWDSLAGGSGTGDVVGPASSTADAFARYADTTGKLLKDSANATMTDAGAPTFAQGAVINESGADSDTRIEGDTDPNLGFFDASADRVGIGTNAPTAKLDVRGSATFNEDGADVDFRVEGDTDTALIFGDASTDRVGIGTNTPGSKLDVRGGLTVNEDGADVDSKIEGDTDPSLTYWDAGQDAVGIGTNTPDAGAKLDVTSTTKAFLPPRMTTTQRDAIASPANGSIIYNTTVAALETRENGAWVTLSKIDQENLLRNGSFEAWELGIAIAPIGYTKAGGGSSVARESTIVKHGTYSLKLTRSGTDCNITKDVAADYAKVNYFKGRTVTLGAWVYATVASRVRIRIADGVGTTNSSYHTGGSSWEWITVTRTIDNSATKVEVGFVVDTGNTDGYFDGATLVDGATAVIHAGHTPYFNRPPRRYEHWHDASIAASGNAITRFIDASQSYSVFVRQNAAAINDQFTFSVFLAAGEYTVSVLGLTNNSSGIQTWNFDDITHGTTMDWYSAGITYNVVKTLTWTALFDGFHYIRCEAASKNAASSGYAFNLTKIWFRPSTFDIA